MAEELKTAEDRKNENASNIDARIAKDIINLYAAINNEKRFNYYTKLIPSDDINHPAYITAFDTLRSKNYTVDIDCHDGERFCQVKISWVCERNPTKFRSYYWNYVDDIADNKFAQLTMLAGALLTFLIFINRK
jgi:hypothetical protein